MLKKSLALMLAFLLTFTLVPSSAFAAGTDDLVFTLSSENYQNVEKGATVTVLVNITQNPGFTGACLVFDCDEGLSVSDILEGDLNTAGSYIVNPDASYVSWQSSNLTKDNTSAGIVFASVVLEVADNVADGASLDVSLIVDLDEESAGVYNQSNDQVSTDFTGATLTITVASTGCKHTSMQHTDAVAATCQAGGNKEFWYCPDCEKYFSDKDGTAEFEGATTTNIDPNNHNWDTDWSTGTDAGTQYHYHKCLNGCNEMNGKANCTFTVATYSDTHHWGECSVCGAEEPGSRAQHTLTVYTASDRNTHTVGCTGCNYTVNENHDDGAWQHDETHHWKNCGCGIQAQKAVHNYGDVEYIWSDNNTKCVASHTCLTCGYLETEEATIKTEVTATPTCVATGSNLLTASFTKFTQTTKSVETAIDATNHDGHVSKTEAKAATCVASGTDAYYYCSACKKYYAVNEDGSMGAQKSAGYDPTIAIVPTAHPALEHHDAVHATCQKAGTVEYWSCATCGKNFSDPDGEYELESIVDPLNPNAHNWDTNWTPENNGHHYHKCLNEGCTNKATETNCSGGTATCQKKAVCSVCSAEYGELAQHTYNVATYSDTQHWTVCSVCGDEKADSRENHSLTYASVSDTQCQQSCSCGCKKTPVDHDFKYIDNTTGHHQECNNCGHKTATVDHTYPAGTLCDDTTATCTCCGHTHSKGDHNTAGVQWQHDGTYHWQICATCQGEVNKAKHEYGEVTYTWNADNTQCTASHTCSCGYEEKEIASGSNIKTKVTATPTCVATGSNLLTATFANSAFTKQEKSVDTAKDSNNHKWDTAWSTGTDAGTQYHYHKCLNGCGEKDSKANCSGGSATCTKKAVCSVCSNEYGQLAQHDYVATYSDTQHWEECKACHAVKDQKTNHSYEDASYSYQWNADNTQCTAKKSCTCGYKITEIASGTDIKESNVQAATCMAAGSKTLTAYFTSNFTNQVKTGVVIPKDENAHNWDTAWTSDGSGHHYHKCLNSGCTKKATVTDCSGGTATCIQKATCTVCSAEYGNYGEHSLTKTDAKAATCEAAGNNEYWTCSVCHKVFKSDKKTETTVAAETLTKLNHDFTKKCTDTDCLATPATCGSPAVYYYSCARQGCTATSSDLTFEYGAATGNHQFENGVCTVCGFVNPASDSDLDNLATASDYVLEDGEGLVVKSIEKLTSEVIAKIKAALAAGRIAMEFDETVNTVVPADATDGGVGVLRTLASDSNITSEQKVQLNNLITKLQSMIADTTNTNNARMTQVVDVTLELIGSPSDILGLVKGLANAITVSIPADEAVKAAFASPSDKVVKAVVVHTDAEGNTVSTSVLDAALSEDGNFVEVEMDQFSTIALVVYDKAQQDDPGDKPDKPGHHHGGSTTNGTAVVQTDLAAGTITAVYVGGVKLDSKYYTVSGSTVTISKDYISTLKAGTYTVKVVGTNGSYTTSITVSVSSTGVVSVKTGDMGLGVWFALLAVSAVLGTAIVVRKRRRV